MTAWHPQFHTWQPMAPHSHTWHPGLERPRFLTFFRFLGFNLQIGHKINDPQAQSKVMSSSLSKNLAISTPHRGSRAVEVAFKNLVLFCFLKRFSHVAQYWVCCCSSCTQRTLQLLRRSMMHLYMRLRPVRAPGL